MPFYDGNQLDHQGFFARDRSKAPRFSTSRRKPIFDEKRATDSPGPGSYGAATSTLSNKGIKIGGSSRFRSNSASGRLEMGGEVTPGPSAYDSHPSVSTPGGVITRARRNINFNRRDDSPGPCQYSANESLLSKKGVPFSRSSRSARTGRVNAFSESPGPCAYNVPQGGYRAPASFPRQKRTAASSITESSPGPCAYQPTYPNQRQNNCGTFGRAKKETVFSKREATPGPGEYTPMYAMSSRFAK
jgi:hypothetical protein|uniref:Uncharacterized protein n=1 Tax=Eutreptiella gymnastica TaxID=73025 RepID=A0A7S4LIB1_9EUGL|mmetsp:Transcript_45109/g.75975  ORF Transcript_45109/g.75975 Transcript_45109/m.75975 type:complete len:245 (-) Transcript_45109:1501-2235(-)